MSRIIRVGPISGRQRDCNDSNFNWKYRQGRSDSPGRFLRSTRRTVEISLQNNDAILRESCTLRENFLALWEHLGQALPGKPLDGIRPDAPLTKLFPTLLHQSKS